MERMLDQEFTKKGYDSMIKRDGGRGRPLWGNREEEHWRETNGGRLQGMGREACMSGGFCWGHDLDGSSWMERVS